MISTNIWAAYNLQAMPIHEKTPRPYAVHFAKIFLPNHLINHFEEPGQITIGNLRPRSEAVSMVGKIGRPTRLFSVCLTIIPGYNTALSRTFQSPPVGDALARIWGSSGGLPLRLVSSSMVICFTPSHLTEQTTKYDLSCFAAC